MLFSLEINLDMPYQSSGSFTDVLGGLFLSVFVVLILDSHLGNQGLCVLTNAILLNLAACDKT